MSTPTRDKVKVYKSRYYRQKPLHEFKEVLYLFRKDRTNRIYVLAYNPGNDFIQKVTKLYNYTTKVKSGYYKEFRLKFIKPTSTYYNFDFSDNMDRLVKYVPTSKERKLDKSSNRHVVDYSKDISEQLDKTNCDSIGELKVYKWLKENNIKFLNQENGHLCCYSPVTGVRLPYDFEIPSAKLVIEIQGIQHYKVTKRMNSTKNKLDKQRYRDQYKRSFAEFNGYTELELSYKDMKNDDRWQAKIKEAIDGVLSN